MRIAGSTALVTGANRGIGLALVDALVAAGARRVYAGARQVASLQPIVDRHGGRVVPLPLDITRPADVTAAVAAASDVSLLVNNAGVATLAGRPFTDPGWLGAARQEFEVNAIGTLAVTQAFAPVLAANGGGAIINLVSIAALSNFPLFASYSASKAALHSITQATRHMLRAQGTFVAGVYAGPVDTEMATEVPFEKVTPAQAATAILEAFEAGEEDILPDPLSRQLGGIYRSGPKALERQVASVG